MSFSPPARVPWLNTGASVLIATAHGGRRDVRACAWHTALDFTPAKLAVCVDKQTFTRALLQASGEFAMGVPCPAQADLLATVGAVSRRDVAGQEKPHPWAPLPPLRRHADMRPRSSAE